jgi:hypothetical protein
MGSNSRTLLINEMEAITATYLDSLDVEPLESARERRGGEALWSATEVLGGGVATILPGNDFGVPSVLTCTLRESKYGY